MFDLKSGRSGAVFVSACKTGLW